MLLKTLFTSLLKYLGFCYASITLKTLTCFQNRVFMKFKVCVFQDESKNSVEFATTVLIDNDMIMNPNDKTEIDFFKNSIELKLKQEYGNSASISVAVQA